MTHIRDAMKAADAEAELFSARLRNVLENQQSSVRGKISTIDEQMAALTAQKADLQRSLKAINKSLKALRGE